MNLRQNSYYFSIFINEKHSSHTYKTGLVNSKEHSAIIFYYFPITFQTFLFSLPPPFFLSSPRAPLTTRKEQAFLGCLVAHGKSPPKRRTHAKCNYCLAFFKLIKRKISITWNGIGSLGYVPRTPQPSSPVSWSLCLCQPMI